MIFRKSIHNSIEIISSQIFSFLKIKKKFIPFYVKSSAKLDIVNFICDVIKRVGNTMGDRPLPDNTSNIAWIFLSNEPYDFYNLQDFKTDFLYLNWQNPNLSVYDDFLQKAKTNKNPIILIIDKSHSFLTEEVFRRFILPANPKIIFKISPSPFESKQDEKIFLKSLSLDNPGCYLVI